SVTIPDTLRISCRDTGVADSYTVLSSPDPQEAGGVIEQGGLQRRFPGCFFVLELDFGNVVHGRICVPADLIRIKTDQLVRGQNPPSAFLILYNSVVLAVIARESLTPACYGIIIGLP